jgi:hypothetical protein
LSKHAVTHVSFLASFDTTEHVSSPQLGELVGDSVGLLVGSLVGNDVGDFEGVWVGTEVGTHVSLTAWQNST